MTVYALWDLTSGISGTRGERDIPNPGLWGRKAERRADGSCPGNPLVICGFAGFSPATRGSSAWSLAGFSAGVRVSPGLSLGSVFLFFINSAATFKMRVRIFGSMPSA